MNSKQCPVCSSQTSLTIWRRENFELYQLPAEAAQVKRSFRMDLVLHFCERCHHAYLWPIPDDMTLKSFYEAGYSGYTSPLETKGVGASLYDSTCRFIAEEAHRRFGRPVRIAEVGGHDGYVLSRLAGIAAERLLIEPGQTGAAIARRHGLPVLEKFLDEGVASSLAEQFDVVISMHVIEHIRDPWAFARELATLLVPGGILVIETPDLPVILQQLRVRTVHLQHLHLFSPGSLRWLLRETGGLRLQRFAFPPELPGFLTFVTKDSEEAKDRKEQQELRTIDATAVMKANALTFAQRLDAHNTRLKNLVSGWKHQGKRVWIWGASTHGGELFNVYGQQREHFEGYIDSDERKASMRYPVAPELSICTPDKAHESGVDAVLINSFSVDEILSNIRQRGWRVEVADIFSAERRSLV